MWRRYSVEDKRFTGGHDFAGDAWRNDLTGEIQYTAVGHRHAEAIDERMDEKYYSEWRTQYERREKLIGAAVLFLYEKGWNKFQIMEMLKLKISDVRRVLKDWNDRIDAADAIIFLQNEFTHEDLACLLKMKSSYIEKTIARKNKQEADIAEEEARAARIPSGLLPPDSQGGLLSDREIDAINALNIRTREELKRRKDEFLELKGFGEARLQRLLQSIDCEWGDESSVTGK